MEGVNYGVGEIKGGFVWGLWGKGGVGLVRGGTYGIVLCYVLKLPQEQHCYKSFYLPRITRS